MTNLKTANKIYSGTSVVSKVYVGTSLAWPTVTIITTGLNVRYTFEDTVVTDTSGSGNNGTISGSPAPILGTGKVGQGMVFAGPTGSVRVPPAAVNVATSTSSFSLMAWIKTSAVDTPIFGGRNAGSANQLLDLVLGYNGVDNASSGRASVIMRADNSSGIVWMSGSVNLANNAFHHVAITFDGSTQALTLYVDGAQAVVPGTAAITSGLTFDTAGCTVGREDANNWGFTGTIDDFRHYTRALTGTEITSIYNMTG